MHLQDLQAKALRARTLDAFEERRSFLEWAQRHHRAAEGQHANNKSLSGAVYTRPMRLRDTFLGIDGWYNDKDDLRRRDTNQSRQARQLKPVLCPYVSPTKIQWQSGLNHESRSFQEQVNYAFAAAKLIKVAEHLIRPRCGLPV
jgi:hypothetical protein